MQPRHGKALFVFGNRNGPRLPRRGIDYLVDANGLIHPTSPPSGASLYGDVTCAPLTGHYHALPGDAALPEGIGITPDGADVGGTSPPTHHTLHVVASMPEDQFLRLFAGLPWMYGGKKT